MYLTEDERQQVGQWAQALARSSGPNGTASPEQREVTLARALMDCAELAQAKEPDPAQPVCEGCGLMSAPAVQLWSLVITNADFFEGEITKRWLCESCREVYKHVISCSDGAFFSDNVRAAISQRNAEPEAPAKGQAE